MIEFYTENSFIINFILAFIVAFVLTFTAIPKIVRVSYRKHLMDVPGERSSHTTKIPNLGGIGIFYGLCVSATIFAHGLFNEYIVLFACLVILMFVGLMDDILVVSPDKKLYAQLAAAFLLVVVSDVRIGNLFGVLGIENLPYIISVLFTIMVFILLINSFNLIDGIDGLAGSIGVVSSSGFAYSFYRLGEGDMVLLSISLIGSLLAFLYFNFSKKMKIIMGDTGSMIVGFLLTFMAIKFLNLLMLETASGQLYYHLPSAPAIALALLIIPLVDMLTVVAIRLKNGCNPLAADKNHIHHRYLNLGLDHKQVTLVMALFNIAILVLTYFLRRMNVNFLGALVLAIGIAFALMPYLITYMKNKKN